MSLRFVRDVDPDEIELEVRYAIAHPEKTELLAEWLVLLDWSGDTGPYADVIGHLEALNTDFIEGFIDELDYVNGLRLALSELSEARIERWCDSCTVGDTTWVGRHRHMRDGSVLATTVDV